jgi:hypothetical protein
LTDPLTYSEHVYYEFLYTIPADWNSVYIPANSYLDADNSNAKMISWYFKAEIKVGELYTFTKTTFDSDWKFEPRAAYNDLANFGDGTSLMIRNWNVGVLEFYEMEAD